jgi:hypothetical protein
MNQSLPILSVQVVCYTVKQLEEQELFSAPTAAKLFPEYNLCQLCKNINLYCKCKSESIIFREYCYQCKGNIMMCDCEEANEAPYCDKCKWQDLVGDILADGFNSCFCDLLIDYGNCPICMGWECKCLK